ncbi:hypothetical protein F0562_010934 [Nyssa sinensis]|uniref:Uncharacterized protein n=1 Tax=Nyssa sinensis TaxID=561372 RepID=A0A5J5A518_9ASTE|nr:hypothetical protein F0562_010934 [Nyssa sinensis]
MSSNTMFKLLLLAFNEMQGWVQSHYYTSRIVLAIGSLLIGGLLSGKHYVPVSLGLEMISIVKTYQEKFEELANKTNGFSKEFFVSCFVSGLNDEIKAVVQMFRPRNVSQAMGLARLQEETIEALAKKNRVYSKSYNSSLPTSSKSMELAPKPVESITAMKKMTQKELEEKRMKRVVLRL